jgi:uncharacterized protein
VLAAIANGNARWGAIAGYIGRRSSDIAHPLNVLEDCGLIVKDEDAFRSGRATYRITEPLITFYEAIMRPRWADLEEGLGGLVWADSRQQFSSAVAGPHFESVCRDFARTRGRELFGRPVGRVAAGTVTDPARHAQIEIDVAVLGPALAGEQRPLISLGEAKWGDTMGLRHLTRLRRARDLLAASLRQATPCWRAIRAPALMPSCALQPDRTFCWPTWPPSMPDGKFFELSDCRRS